MPFLTAPMARSNFISAWLAKALSLILLLAIVPALALSLQNPFDVHLLPKEFVAGTSSLISWIPTAERTVTLKLFSGAPKEMQYVSTIARTVVPSSYPVSLLAM
jgi:hypothetical protein